MAAVSAPRSSSPPRNQLLAAMSAPDFALLKPHLRPVALELLKDLERPNRPIETVFDQRLARWILMAHDRTRDNTLPLTHEFLADAGRQAGWGYRGAAA